LNARAFLYLLLCAQLRRRRPPARSIEHQEGYLAGGLEGDQPARARFIPHHATGGESLKQHGSDRERLHDG
jgi:hypothetical protein